MFLKNLIQRFYLQNGQVILDKLAKLKLRIVDRYEKWRQAHPDGVDMDTTVNVRTPQLPNENAARASAQQNSRIQDEEAARAARQLKEQEQLAVQQRQHLEQEAQRQEMAASASLKSPLPPKVLLEPPDLSFSRPNVQIPVLGHGSQSTVVPMNSTGDHYYWSRRKCRAAETCSTVSGGTRISLADGDVTNDSGSLNQDFRRLGMDYQSEEAARVTRQGLTSPNLLYPSNIASANAQQTFSLFPTHLGASSSTVPKLMFYPTVVQPLTGYCKAAV